MNRTNGHVKTTILPSTIPDRQQPNNVEAEQSLLGSALIDQDTVIKVAEYNIRPADFYIQRNGWIWAAIYDLTEAGGPIDIVSLTDELERRGQLNKIGGSAYLTELINIVPSSVYGHHYAGIVKRTSVMRQLIEASQKIVRLAHRDELEAQAAIEQATDILLEVSKANTRQQTKSLTDIANDFLDRIELLQSTTNGITGLPTGLKDLDRLTSGLQRGDLILLAGRPAMGKSALAVQVALEAAINYQARTLLFSREMSGESLFQRMVSYQSGIDVKRIRSGQVQDGEYQSLVSVTGNTAKLPIVIDDFTATPEAMRARAIIEQQKHGLDLVIVDYLQRVDPPNSRGYKNKVAEVGAVSSMLKNMALNLNIPVLAISSLSRKCEERHNKRPGLSDLRESGDLEYDADVVLFLYRDEVYNPDTEYPNVAEISISKHRQGPEGIISVYFEKELTKFANLEISIHSLDWVK